MPDGSESSASSSTTSNRGAALTSDVAAIKSQLADVQTIKSQLAELLSSVRSPGPRGAPPPDAELPAVGGPSAPVQPLVDPSTGLHFALPPPSAKAISDALALKQAYADTGKLCHFEKSRTLPPFPAKKFIPEPSGLFGRIKTADTRDGWEAEVLWNLGHNAESSLAAAHRVAECLAAGDIAAASDAFSVVHHYLQANYERIQERVDFFADSLESGKSEAILLQKYLREDDQPYTSALYRDTKRQFADLRAKAFAKELNQQAAKPADRRNRGRNSRDALNE